MSFALLKSKIYLLSFILGGNNLGMAAGSGGNSAPPSQTPVLNLVDLANFSNLQ